MAIDALLDLCIATLSFTVGILARTSNEDNVVDPGNEEDGNHWPRQAPSISDGLMCLQPPQKNKVL